MQIEKIEFDQVRYNPELSAFETLIRIHDQGRTYTYPTSVKATVFAEFGDITRRLSESAARSHADKYPGLRMSAPATDTDYEARVAEILASGAMSAVATDPRVAA